MYSTSDNFNFIDNGGRRVFPDRRQFLYAFHMPERRKSEKRKNGQADIDGDQAIEKRFPADRRSGLDRRLADRYPAQQTATRSFSP